MSYCQSCANLERALAEETERSSRATTLLEDERRRYRFQLKRAEKAEADLARLAEENEALREECAKPLLEISGAESVDEALDIFRREREANVGLATEAARWHTFCDYWAASAVLECTQDEEGTWSIRQIEPVEGLLLPLTGDTPDAAIDAAIKEGS